MVADAFPDVYSKITSVWIQNLWLLTWSYRQLSLSCSSAAILVGGACYLFMCRETEVQEEAGGLLIASWAEPNGECRWPQFQMSVCSLRLPCDLAQLL